MTRIHQNPTALIKSGSFRPSQYLESEAGHGKAVVFKTSALNHSAISPTARIPMTDKRILSSGRASLQTARIRKNDARIPGGLAGAPHD